MITRMRTLGAAASERLKERGAPPTLCIFRAGDRPDDLAYENTIKKAAGKVGVSVITAEFAFDATTEGMIAAVRAASEDDSVHGILVFRPLPPQMDEAAVCSALPPEKDVDGIGLLPMALLYKAKTKADIEELKQRTFLPATAEASLAILKEYDIPLPGKKVVVIGRSTVIGKPAAMLLLTENATVTIAHSRSDGLEEIARAADILIVCVGVTKKSDGGGVVGAIGASYLSPGQTVIDVGMNAAEGGLMIGDVSAEAASEAGVRVTPVPGGVGGVTTQTLLAHVITAAERKLAASTKAVSA